MPSSTYNDEIDEARLKQALAERDIYLFDCINSTNQYLLEQAKALKHQSFCLAREQTAGRGRRGRAWHSPNEGNIYLSQFFHCHPNRQVIAGLSLAVGVAIAETLSALDVPDIKLKWPNDLYWQNKKLGGILLESVPIDASVLGIVVGVGINFSMLKVQPCVQMTQDWVSLAQIVSKPMDKNAFLISLIEAIEKAVTLCVQEGLQSFISRWQQFDNYLNQPVRVLAEDKEIQGIARGIDAQGALLVEVQTELMRFHSSEVSLRADANPKS